MILHELAHAYQDRVLVFDQPEILAGYRAFCDSRRLDRVPHFSDPYRPHDDLTDHKEYFAEMTETFFVGNDCHPIMHRMLYDEHRPSNELLVRVWGSAIKPPKHDDSHGPGILELRIKATMVARRSEFDEAFNLIAEAERRDADAEGHIAELRKRIEELHSKGSAHEDGP